MSAHPLNPAQAEAADLSTSAVVSAGAGSGKTRVLVTRWVQALALHGFRPERLLAITFTDKAAGEMLERVRVELDARVAAGGEQAAGWKGAREGLWRAQIGTIHSFCSSLLREFPLEAGVDPDFGVLEEIDRGVLIDEVAAQTVDRLAERDLPALDVLARLWGRRYVCARVAELLTDRSRAELWAGQVTGRSPGALRKEWTALAEGIRDAARGRVLQAPLAPSALEETGGWPKLIAAVLTQRHEPRKRIREEWQPLAEAAAREGAALMLGLDEATAAADKLLSELTPALSEIALVAIERYDQHLERSRRLDFDTLQRLAGRLLAERADVRARVRARYDQVFVDEAQDTAPEQWALIRAVAGDGGGELSAGGFFAVGDRQQSIYGFRGADPGQFTALGAQMEAAGGRRIRLATSYRMRAAPLALTNHLAGRLFDEPEPLDAGRPDAGGDDPGAVELIVTDDGDAAGVQVERLAGAVVGRIVQLMERRGLRSEECALLVRSRSHLEIWEDALWRADLPFVTAAGVGFFQRREIYDLAALLAFLHDARNDIALATVLRSPLFALSDAGLVAIAGFRRGGLWKALRDRAEAPAHEDDRQAAAAAVEVLGRLRRLSGRMPAGPLLRLAVEETGYIGVLAAAPRGEQALANVEKLIAIVRNEAGPLGPLVRRLDRLLGGSQRESQAALAVEGREGVRVMTIHASKGLEFPLVAVGDLGRQLRSSLTDSLYLDRLEPGGPLCLAPSLAGRAEGVDQPVIRWLIGQRRQAAARAEEARLLYVACTRARDVLLLAATLSKTGRPGGARPVDLLRDPLALGWSEGEVAATLTASAVPASALPAGLAVPIRSTVVAESGG